MIHRANYTAPLQRKEAPSAQTPPPPPQTEDPDEALLKRTFVWGGASAAIGVASSLATMAAYAMGGDSVGLAVQLGLCLAGGIGGGMYVANFLHTPEPHNRTMGFLAGAGAMALTTTAGRMAAGQGFLTGLMAAQVSGGFGLLYGGYGSIVLGHKETNPGDAPAASS